LAEVRVDIIVKELVSQVLTKSMCQQTTWLTFRKKLYNQTKSSVHKRFNRTHIYLPMGSLRIVLMTFSSCRVDSASEATGACALAMHQIGGAIQKAGFNKAWQFTRQCVN
jgi:hypothetical protein